MLTDTIVSITFIATLASAIEGSVGVLTSSVAITSVSVLVTLIHIGAVDAITIITGVAVAMECSDFVDTRCIVVAVVGDFRALIKI